MAVSGCNERGGSGQRLGILMRKGSNVCALLYNTYFVKKLAKIWEVIRESIGSH
jgi:hypothetical protein